MCERLLPRGTGLPVASRLASRFPVEFGFIPTALIVDLCPAPGCDGDDAFGVVDDGTPGAAAGIDDLIVGVPHADAEVAGAQVFPDVFDGVQLRRAAWEVQQADIGRRQACRLFGASPRLGRISTACAPGQTVLPPSAKCRLITSLLTQGMTKAGA